MPKRTIRNWGGYPSATVNLVETTDRKTIAQTILQHEKIIARGNGRCYGDSSLQETVLSTLRMDRILELDTDNGSIHCESGILLDTILRAIVPKGFFLPVTPGTKYITVGGAVAANVHGKNHPHAGGFCNYVSFLELMTADGSIHHCSRETNTELFEATLGGMGLTGVILSVRFKLNRIETAFLRQRAICAPDLSSLMQLFEEHASATHVVAWIDGLATGKALGKGLLSLGEQATRQALPEHIADPLALHDSPKGAIPMMFPSFMMNRLTGRLFNWFHYQKAKRKGADSLIHYDPFFYPLDAWMHWNRVYGKTGMLQYQFVVPVNQAEGTIRRVLDEITRSGCTPFLSVLKKLGKRDLNVSSLSFPEPGYTLAIDFKATKAVFKLLDRLDKIVLDHGGKLNLCKDARMSKDIFRKTYQFQKPAGKFISFQFDRIC